jgi:hypothetical protein
MERSEDDLSLEITCEGKGILIGDYPTGKFEQETSHLAGGRDTDRSKSIFTGIILGNQRRTLSHAL